MRFARIVGRLTSRSCGLVERRRMSLMTAQEDLMSNLRLPALIVVAAVAIAACSGGASPTPSAAAASTATSPSAAAGGGAGTVDIKNTAFNPTSITVKVGDKVTWTNNDGFAHTVTADDNSFDSNNVDGGKTFDHTFTTAGTFAYHCKIHPFMKATVTVTG
jgi:plastocyanin